MTKWGKDVYNKLRWLMTFSLYFNSSSLVNGCYYHIILVVVWIVVSSTFPIISKQVTVILPMKLKPAISTTQLLKNTLSLALKSACDSVNELIGSYFYYQFVISM